MIQSMYFAYLLLYNKQCEKNKVYINILKTNFDVWQDMVVDLRMQYGRDTS